MRTRLLLSIVLLGFPGWGASGSAQDIYQVGIASVDITPDYPIRLNGFGNRREESAGVSQRIFAKALAISSNDQPPLVLVTLDSLGIRTPLVQEVERRLAESHQLPPENLAVTFTHSHCTPKVNGACDNIFSSPIPPDHQVHIDRYTKELTDQITAVARQALDSTEASHLAWTVGEVTFAKNRRRAGGPVDHDLPILVVRSAETGDPRAVYVSYACHCVTLSFNQISGDWAGYASAMIERQFPGVTAMVSIGAGSDQNPISGVVGDQVEVAAEQGLQIADEVKQRLEGPLREINGTPAAVKSRIPLPLNERPTREELQRQTQSGRPTDKYNAATQLARLERGEELIHQIDYTIQTWHFGDSFCMTFLAGEVCVDYSLRLKTALDRERFWLNTYSNDFCCYIPSERLLKEGGYGGGSEVPYFALPSTLAAGLEQRIVDEVLRQVPPTFQAPQGTLGISPLPPRDSLRCIQTGDGLRVELVAAEPDVQDPVAIDFGPDGRLWVAEMHDYGRGVYETFSQNSRVRWLRDEDADGQFEIAQTFVDGLRFPTDVKAWRDGVLICDAPEIKFARDTTGDGRADEITTLFSGFEVRNAQARVNSLRWGLDGWLHGSCGLFGGKIKSHLTGETVDCSNRDFRIRPDSGAIEPIPGRTQQGRDRNDWGDWFGCSNGTLLRAIPATPGRGKSHISPSTPTMLSFTDDALKLFPPKQLVTFELTGTPGQATSACGLGIYRDQLLGIEFQGDAFTCEPVHQAVHRIDLRRAGHGFAASRGAGESSREFLTSSDRWFRPVQVRTGPDGGLWIVDMYRFVIEHPRWIPQSTLSELDVFAGRTRGRIYRVLPQGHPRDSQAILPDLSKLDNRQLAAQLGSPNGTVRDLAHQLLVWRKAADADDDIRLVAVAEGNREGQVQALAALRDLDRLAPTDISTALTSNQPETVLFAIRLTESWLEHSTLHPLVLKLSGHQDARIRRAVALSLDQIRSDTVTATLIRLIGDEEKDPDVRSAAISRIGPRSIDEVLRKQLSQPQLETTKLTDQIVEIALRIGNVDTVQTALQARLQDTADHLTQAQATSFKQAFQILDDRSGEQPLAVDASTADQLRKLLHAAFDSLQDPNADDAVIQAAFSLIGRKYGGFTRELLSTARNLESHAPEARAQRIAAFISPQRSIEIQRAALHALNATQAANIPTLLLDSLPSVGPALRLELLDGLTERESGISALLVAIADGRVRRDLFDATRRQKLLSVADPRLRARANSVFDSVQDSPRSEVVASYAGALDDEPDTTAGEAVFRKHCSNCHRMADYGHEVGPDLRGLTNRDPHWLLVAILHPNKEVDGRYLSWNAATVDGRTHSGMIVEESQELIRLREAGGKEHLIVRRDLELFQSSEKSVMPEGLEKDLSRADVRNVIAFLLNSTLPPKTPSQPPRYPPQIAPFLLDESVPIKQREKVIHDRPGMGPAILSLLVKDWQDLDDPARNQRIPWIWRVAIAVGKRNDGGEIRDVLEISLPQHEEPLLEWQAVVIGGGIINGISQLGRSPNQRLDEILNGLPEAQGRWPDILELSASMADDPSVKPGTRYDALRMVALREPEVAVPHLAGYLKPDSDRQLQMGAVSGLVDVAAPQADTLLADALAWLQDRNRALALEGMLRSDARVATLSRLITEGGLQVPPNEANPLINHAVEAIRTRARAVLSE